MLGRTKLRRFAIGAIADHSHPYGPTCDCIGPIWENCEGVEITVLDSPTGMHGDVWDDGETVSPDLPVISIYVDDNGSTFDADGGFPKMTSSLTLLVEIMMNGDKEREVEDACDELQERVLYRLLRQDPVDYFGQLYPPIVKLQPQSIRTATNREKNDRIVFTRSIQIELIGCDSFDAPICDGCVPTCATICTTAI